MSDYRNAAEKEAAAFADSRVGRWGNDQATTYTMLAFLGVGGVVILFGNLAGMNPQEDHAAAVTWTVFIATLSVWLFCRSQTKRWWQVYTQALPTAEEGNEISRG